jgi:hypothetical protein
MTGGCLLALTHRACGFASEVTVYPSLNACGGIANIGNLKN